MSKRQRRKLEAKAAKAAHKARMAAAKALRRKHHPGGTTPAKSRLGNGARRVRRSGGGFR
jgi:hypothetical protein